MRITIRKWGNSAGTILPATLLAEVGLSVGDEVEAHVEQGQIVLKAAVPSYSLEELLAACPEEGIDTDEDDRVWLEARPVGKEWDR